MALAIDASTPAIAVQSTGTTATVATASFTPPAGSVLAILYSANTIDPNNPGNPSITDNLGAHLTYQSWEAGHQPDSPTADGQVATWTARVITSSAMTVTVTNGAASPNRHAALCVLVFTGADVTSDTSPVGAHGKNSATVSTSSIAQNYTATATNGWGVMTVCDWDAKGAETAGTGCTLIGSNNIGAPDISYAFVRRTTADDSNGATNTLRATLPAGSTNLRWAWLEIIPAASTTPTFPPSRIVRRDAVWPRLTVQAAIRSMTPVRAQVNPPYPVQEVDQPRRLRGWLARRGKAVTPVPTQINVIPPTFPPAEVVQPRRVRGVLARRGHSTTVYPNTTAPTNPTLPLGLIRHLTRLVAFLRRGRVVRALTEERPTPVQVRHRAAVPAIRRGRIYRPIGVSTPAVAPPHIPRVVRAKWAKPFARRGRVVVYLFPGAAGNPCVVLRPSTGSTSRPGSGTTGRPGTGSTAYVSGITPRPNTGTTDDPC